MKKNTTKIAVVFIVLVIGIVGLYAFFSTRQRETLAETQLSAAQLVLMRDLDKDYPPTVKQVVSYFTEIQECFYNEECTEEEIEKLGMQARKLYDQELLDANEVSSYLIRLKEDIDYFRSHKLKIQRVSVAASNNVETFKQDGYEFGRIHCNYYFADESGTLELQEAVYLLRRGEDRKWKIYGWDQAEKMPGMEE